MGNTGAVSMAEAVYAGDTTLDDALSWHLTANHYPPHPAWLWLPTIKLALEYARDEDYEHYVGLPDGVTTDDGSTVVEVADLIEVFHLEAFVGLSNERRAA